MRFVVVAILLSMAAAGAHAVNLDCGSLARKHGLSGKYLQGFMKECLLDQKQEERVQSGQPGDSRATLPRQQIALRPDRSVSSARPVAATCATVEDCADLSLLAESESASPVPTQYQSERPQATLASCRNIETCDDPSMFLEATAAGLGAGGGGTTNGGHRFVRLPRVGN